VRTSPNSRKTGYLDEVDNSEKRRSPINARKLFSRGLPDFAMSAPAAPATNDGGAKWPV